MIDWATIFAYFFMIGIGLMLIFDIIINLFMIQVLREMLQTKRKNK